MKLNLLAILNSVAFVGVIALNALANLLPINGMNTGEVSALYPSMFTPAGFTFSIWSVIYLLLLGFVCIQWKLREESFFKKLSLWYLVSCLANASWIIAWHYLYIVASMVIMIILLMSLTKIFLLLCPLKFSALENVFVRSTFTVYFSWICVATIANLSALLVSTQWSGYPLQADTWTVLLIIIATSLSIFITLQYNTSAYIMVTIWALFGIYSRWNGTDQKVITITALFSSVILTMALIFSIIRPMLLINSEELG